MFALSFFGGRESGLAKVFAKKSQQIPLLELPLHHHRHRHRHLEVETEITTRSLWDAVAKSHRVETRERERVSEERRGALELIRSLIITKLLLGSGKLWWFKERDSRANERTYERKIEWVSELVRQMKSQMNNCNMQNQINKKKNNTIAFVVVF